MGLSLELSNSPKLPLLGPSMGLMKTRNHPYYNPLNKPQAFAWLGPLKLVAWLGAKIKVFRLALRVI
ncbi:unnamed protein product [Prunus armeniaca]